MLDRWTITLKLSTKVAELTKIIAPSVAACGVALWGIEFLPQGRRSLLRIYIETLAENRETQQITIDDCAAVTHQVSGALEVHDPIAGEYVLEVSSPGLDRAFFSAEQMHAYIGQTIDLRLIHAVEDKTGKRRKVKGRLDSINDKQLQLTNEEATYQIDLNNIDKANLVYQ